MLDELIRKGTTINAIISPSFIWIAGSKFGLSINAMQVWVTSMPQSMRGFAFRTEAAAGPLPGALTAAAPAPAASRKFEVQDDDDEEAEEN